MKSEVFFDVKNKMQKNQTQENPYVRNLSNSLVLPVAL